MSKPAIQAEDYILPRGYLESCRLTGQHALLMQKSNTFLHPDIEDHVTSSSQTKVPITIADMACGNGIWTVEAARKYPNSTVTGFDISPDQFPAKGITQENVEFKLLNLFIEDLPKELRGQFDIVHVRLLRNCVPGISPERMMLGFQNIHNMLKSTGFLQWEEIVYPYFNVHDPNSANPLEPLNGEDHADYWSHFDLAFDGFFSSWKSYDWETSIRQAGFDKAEASKFLRSPELLPYESAYVSWVGQEFVDKARKRVTGEKLDAVNKSEAGLRQITAAGYLLGYEMCRYVGWKTSR